LIATLTSVPTQGDAHEIVPTVGIRRGHGDHRSRLGENDYRLLTNNCEHFCNWCLSGVSLSAQVARPFGLPFRVLGALFHA
jgi:hypothetical protein